MERAFDLVGKSLQRLGIAPHALASHITHRADGWLQRHAAHLTPFLTVRRLKDGVLHISSTHSIALQECQQLLPQLLAFLRAGNSASASIVDIRLERSDGTPVDFFPCAAGSASVHSDAC